MILAALSASIFTLSHFDNFGLQWLGLLIGLPVLFCLFLMLNWVFWVLVVLCEGLLTGLPLLTSCERCGCRSGWLADYGDYDPVLVGDEWCWKCHCGRVFRRDGQGRVREIGRDGDSRPYKVWKPLRGWQDDHSGP